MPVYKTTSEKLIEFPDGLERVIVGETAIAEKFVGTVPGMEESEAVFYFEKIDGAMHTQCRVDYVARDKKEKMLIVEVHSNSSLFPEGKNAEELQEFYLELYISQTTIAHKYFGDNWVECWGEVKLK